MSKDITNNRLRLILVIAPILIGTAAYVGAGIYDEFHSKNYSQLTSTSSSEQEGVSDAFSWVHSARHNRWRSFRATAPKGATFSDPLTGLEPELQYTRVLSSYTVGKRQSLLLSKSSFSALSSAAIRFISNG